MSRPVLRLALLAAVAGCDTVAPADSSNADLGAPAHVIAEGLVATLQVTPARVAPGGEFTVRVGLTNGTADSARVTLSCPALAMLSLRTPAGAEVDGTADLPAGCLGVIATLRLAAGRDTTVELRGRAAELTYPPLAWRPLARGTYTLGAAPTPIELNGRPVRLPEVTRRLVVE
jgi:hypothetical protein